jgi:hypothetical protein
MLSKKRRTLVFFEAGILTLIVYLFSIMANSYLDTERFLDINQKLLAGSIDSDTLYSQNQFYSTFEISNCNTRKEQIYSQFKNLKKLGTDITNYGQLYLEKNKETSDLKKRTYFLDQLKLYGEILQYNYYCEDKIMPIIYFYNGLSSQIDKQSIILEQFSINNKNKTIILSFDIFSENEPILNNIKSIFNISFTPFILINNKTTKDFITSENIISLNSLDIEYNFFSNQTEIKSQTYSNNTIFVNISINESSQIMKKNNTKITNSNDGENK